MVVVAILGILAVVAMQVFGDQSDKAKFRLTKTIVSKIAGKVELFRLEHQKPPRKLEDLIRRPSYVDSKEWPIDGYVQNDEELLDAWGKPLNYRQPGNNASYDLFSTGADQREGGDGVNEDIWNHSRGK